MSEITKLYENAGVKSVGFNPYKLEDEYPPFTAEKQFFILKFFADNKICGERLIIQFLWDDIGEQYYFYLQVPPDCYHAHDKDYNIALAKVVNIIWAKLAPEQQQQIKEILG